MDNKKKVPDEQFCMFYKLQMRWRGLSVEAHGQTAENTLTLRFDLKNHMVFFHAASYQIAEHI